ncbi:hypothetical protein, partial [Flintibacter muris]|uniref:hypothetical protein n=1 Tax=Flintibacter muris TaxID=2941327 RepID=UPI00203BF156
FLITREYFTTFLASPLLLFSILVKYYNASTLLLAHGRGRDYSTSAELHTVAYSAKHGGFTGLLASSFSLHHN